MRQGFSGRQSAEGRVKRTRLWLVCASMLSCELLASGARANPDPPAMYDARSVGMGGAGVASAEGGAAIYYNPALMERYDKGAVTLVVTPFILRPEAPVYGPDAAASPSQQHNVLVAPLVFLGGGYRVAKWLVVGLAGYASGGVGAKFDNVAAADGDNYKSLIVSGELSIPFSFRLAKGLSLGVAPRFTYTREDNYFYQMGFVVDQTLDGFSFLGLNAGIYYQPVDWLQLGFDYRSKVHVATDGKTTTINPATGTPIVMNAETKSASNLPHSFRLGGAAWLDHHRLQIALDLKFWLYNESNKTVPLDVGGLSLPVTLDWKNSFGLSFGAEYWFNDHFAGRLGYAMSTSATPNHTANAYEPPPGVLQSFHIGAGYKTKDYSVDFGGYYHFGHHTIRQNAAMSVPNPGTYKVDAWALSVSGTYYIH